MCLKLLKHMIINKKEKEKKNNEPISNLTLKIDEKIKELCIEKDDELNDVKLKLKKSFLTGEIDRKKLNLKKIK